VDVVGVCHPGSGDDGDMQLGQHRRVCHHAGELLAKLLGEEGLKMWRSWGLKRWVVLGCAVLLICGASLGPGSGGKPQSDESLIGGRNKWVCFVAAVATFDACASLNAPLCAFGIMWLEQNC
jgi:hypothetical protein